jgi:hypothetical protein
MRTDFLWLTQKPGFQRPLLTPRTAGLTCDILDKHGKLQILHISLRCSGAGSADVLPSVDLEGNDAIRECNLFSKETLPSRSALF